tara:strand:+ start:3632 stop:4462 length:831 start_codon:yes stop_codon:yes gene_type:complete
MNVAIGTGGLTANFEKGYWNLFNYAVENDYYIHSAINYLNVEQYFNNAYLNQLKVKKVIFKIEINKNPIKKIINIPKQIDLICKKFKIECIDTIQICNNPNANSLNMFLLKKILTKEKKKGLVKNFFLESFIPFSNNLIKLTNDGFFDGFIFKINILQRGVSKSFLYNILNAKKKIISISPLASGNFEKIINNLDNNFKIELEKIMNENKLKDYVSLNIAFLKAINQIEFCIFGTKKLDRLIDIKNQINITNPLKFSDVEKIFRLQEKYNPTVNYK